MELLDKERAFYAGMTDESDWKVVVRVPLGGHPLKKGGIAFCLGLPRCIRPGALAGRRPAARDFLCSCKESHQRKHAPRRRPSGSLAWGKGWGGCVTRPGCAGTQTYSPKAPQPFVVRKFFPPLEKGGWGGFAFGLGLPRCVRPGALAGRRPAARDFLCSCKESHQRKHAPRRRPSGSLAWGKGWGGCVTRPGCAGTQTYSPKAPQPFPQTRRRQGDPKIQTPRMRSPVA